MKTSYKIPLLVLTFWKVLFGFAVYKITLEKGKSNFKLKFHFILNGIILFYFFFKAEKTCKCNLGFYGEGCDINENSSIGKNKWYQISSYTPFMKNRGEHVSEFISSLNKLFIFGGECSFWEFYLTLCF